MIDSQGRNINKLRISLTEVCNMACSYCVSSIKDHNRDPDELIPSDLLSLVRMLKDHAGIEKVRLTGGEPLLYPNLISIISGIREMGIDSIGITTNGQLLARKAKELFDSGLKSVNMSLDSLKPENFKRMGRVGKLHKTLEGIEVCMKLGILVKINMVVIKGDNDDEVLNMLEFCIDKGIEVRYLELMSMGLLHNKDDLKLVTMDKILEKISTRYKIKPIPAESDSTSLRYCVPGGYFGIIPNKSEPFCATCSRLRLTSDGQLIGCLSNPATISIRHLLGNSNPEKLLQSIVKKSISYKQDVTFTGSSLVMSRVGG